MLTKLTMGNININIPDDLHKQARVKAAVEDISLKELIILAIKKEVKI